MRDLRGRASRLVAMLACAAVLAAPLESFHHGVFEADAACDVGVVVHDASAHRIGAGAPGAPETPEHCFVCHWARTFNLAPGLAKRLAAREVRPATRLVHAATPLAAAPELSNLPARAPPQFS